MSDLLVNNLFLSFTILKLLKCFLCFLRILSQRDQQKTNYYNFFCFSYCFCDVGFNKGGTLLIELSVGGLPILLMSLLPVNQSAIQLLTGILPKFVIQPVKWQSGDTFLFFFSSLYVFLL